MADYGIKVSKPGFDVTTATDIQLAFTSKYFINKIAVQGTATLTMAGATFLGGQPRTPGTGFVTLSNVTIVTHPPTYVLCQPNGSSFWFVAGTDRISTTWGPDVKNQVFLSRSDNSNVVIKGFNFDTSSSIDATVKYFIFEDQT